MKPQDSEELRAHLNRVMAETSKRLAEEPETKSPREAPAWQKVLALFAILLLVGWFAVSRWDRNQPGIDDQPGVVTAPALGLQLLPPQQVAGHWSGFRWQYERDDEEWFQVRVFDLAVADVGNPRGVLKLQSPALTESEWELSADERQLLTSDHILWEVIVYGEGRVEVSRLDQESRR